MVNDITETPLVVITVDRTMSLVAFLTKPLCIYYRIVTQFSYRIYLKYLYGYWMLKVSHQVSVYNGREIRVVSGRLATYTTI